MEKAGRITVPKLPQPYLAHPYPLQENFTGRAKERAWCDGPPHCYRKALDEAEAMLAELPQGGVHPTGTLETESAGRTPPIP
jgi:hypothetical protein